jgi:peptidyl-tRNA hydrolase
MRVLAAVSVFVRFVDQGFEHGRSRLAMWMGSGTKPPGSSGFDPRRTQTQPLTHYCVIRQDLPRGVLAAQLIHAAGESSRGILPPHTFAVALAAKDEAHLESLEQALRRLDIPHRAIREPDPPWNGALMAIGIVPVADRGTVKRVTGSLKLLR